MSIAATKKFGALFARSSKQRLSRRARLTVERLEDLALLSTLGPFSATVPVQATDFDTSISLPQFDSSLYGTLNFVKLD